MTGVFNQLYKAEELDRQLGKEESRAAVLREQILAVLKKGRQSAFTVPQVMAAMSMRQQDKVILINEMKEMQSEGLIVKVEGGRFGLPGRLGYLTGTLQGNRRGFAFLRPDQQKEDIFISAKNLKTAAHGDRVLVRLEGKQSKRRREGTVIGILKRGRNRLVGDLHREGKKHYIVPDDRRYPEAILISRQDAEKIPAGEKVVVEIEKWAQGRQPARGRVIDHIGMQGTARAEGLAFKYRFDLPGEFPPAALKELDILPAEDDIAELAERQGRVDLTALKMVTIDDETAKDFDDAVSLELTEKGEYRLGVHIADVSQYVREGKALDREALKRGTSIYLVEKVIHMLPPLLSEKICSLQAGKDRLAVSVIMDIDNDGMLVKADFVPSLVRVAERLTYQKVESYLRSGKKDLFQDEDLAAMLDEMAVLAARLRRRRFERGALNLDMPEARIVVNEEGFPLSVEKRCMGQSESLIEEFMIYCNETVASYLAEKKLPCLFRVHAVPTNEKLALLRDTLSLIGVPAVKNMKVIRVKQLKRLLEETSGAANERLVSYLVLRSLPQARYSAVNEGHFGLASACYCHFTSPIRRYPDLVVHRILKQQLSSGGLSADKIKRLNTRLPAIAQQSSERERAAVEAERASMDIKKAQYMAGKLGEKFSGIISGVTNFGLFVELDNTIEGMIPIGELGDDYYVFHEKAAALIGERLRKTYRLGDVIEIEVVRVNAEEGKITFHPVK